MAEVRDWAAGLEEVQARIAGAFARTEPPARCRPICAGCPGSRNARTAGRWPRRRRGGPRGMQQLLRTADWNADAVGDQPRASVVERLGRVGC